MGYRGKVVLRERAREMRAEGSTMPDIAAALGVARSSVSLWTKDAPFAPGPRRRGRQRGPNVLQRRKAAEIEELIEEGRRRIGCLTEKEFLVAGAALYAGEGTKRDGAIAMPNSDPRMLVFFVTWLRRFFDIDESRLRVRLYLHEGLDLEVAEAIWSDLLAIPRSQFGKPYRAVADPSIRTAKHPLGCPSVRYCCSRTHRAVMGLVAALLSSEAVLPG
jgi:hypothetical protein